MAETLLFSIPVPSEGQDPIYEVLWYQSNDGAIWDVTPIDTILAASLTIDTATGKYAWISALADPTRWHCLKTRNQVGTESLTGIIIHPRLSAENPIQSSYTGIKLDTGETEYKIGEYVSFLLNVDKDVAAALGNTMTVHIVDTFNNILDTKLANKVGADLYELEYTIPVSIGEGYNQGGVDESLYLSSLYYLKDRWMFQDGTSLEYSFTVARAPEDPIKENCEIYITINGLLAEDGSSSEEETVKFTTKLTPFYCTVQDVVDTFRDGLSTYDTFAIARSIREISSNVDHNLMPNSEYITYPTIVANAVTNYTKHRTAYEIIAALMLYTSEQKQLESFMVSRTMDPKILMEHIHEDIEKYENIILAGGYSDPYGSQTFVKGIFDPNRPSVSRATLDTSDPWPFVNSSSKSVSYTDHLGNTVEVRGKRTLSYRYPSRLAIDNLDVSDNLWGKIK